MILKKEMRSMFFIYFGFGIGVLAVLTLMLPALLKVVLYIGSLFANFKDEMKYAKEFRAKEIELKKDMKLAKLEEKYGKQEKEEVWEEEPEVEDEHEEVEVEETKAEEPQYAPYHYGEN